VRQLDLKTFLAADFEGRIRLMNQVHGARLWSQQLASIWTEVLDGLAAKGGDIAVRQLMWELMALAPDSEAAERAYHGWIGDNDRPVTAAPPAIVHLVVSCHKEQNKAKAIALYRQLSRHFRPIFIVVGDEHAGEEAFDAPFLTVPAPDNYEGLTRKVLEGLVAVRRKYGQVGVLKIDDDTQLIATPQRDRIAELIATTQYAGTIVGDSNFDRCWHVGKRERLGDGPYRRRFRGSWASGPLYYLGPRAVELLVRECLFYPGEFDGEDFGLEDKAIGDVLRTQGVQPISKNLSPIFGIAGPFSGSFGDHPPALGPLQITE
jgi:hypothetical protein